MRYREHSEDDVAQARAAVAEWREQNPDGSPEEMLAAVGPAFHQDYGPVLCAHLFRLDLRNAEVTTGIKIITGETR